MICLYVKLRFKYLRFLLLISKTTEQNSQMVFLSMMHLIQEVEISLSEEKKYKFK